MRTEYFTSEAHDIVIHLIIQNVRLLPLTQDIHESKLNLTHTRTKLAFFNGNLLLIWLASPLSTWHKRELFIFIDILWQA